VVVRFTRQAVTDLTIPAGKPYHIAWDEALPGFGVRINPTGKVWVVQYRAAGKSRRETIGRVDAIPLDEARKRAKASIARAQLGGDPQAEKAEEKARASVTLAAVSEHYLREAKRRLRSRSYETAERYLNSHWAPLGPIALHKVRRAEIASRLSEIAQDHGYHAANGARAALSAFFGWAMGQGLVDLNPVIGTNKATEELSRDHVLTDAELASVWRACGDDDYGRIVRLLILTGQRREEVGGVMWSEVDLSAALWTIPKRRAKNGREHEVPLAPPALEILTSVPRRDKRALLFGGGEGGFAGWSKAKIALDKRIAESGATIRPWRLHDLRRTMATGMGDKLGVLPHVVEAILNHVSGHKAGVAGVYNKATYRREKRDALERWASATVPSGGSGDSQNG
jgi:integrase